MARCHAEPTRTSRSAPPLGPLVAALAGPSLLGRTGKRRGLGVPRRARLYDALSLAWRYYSLDGLAAVARRRLAERSVDVSALESREGRALGGHTPRSRTGLAEHLRRHRFSHDEGVDAGLISRYGDGRVEDFFTHRLVLPVRGQNDRVVGLIGRDVCGGMRAKHLKTPRTTIYDKSQQLYRPSRASGCTHHNLVVVEGPIDALAVEAAAACAGVAIAAVSPSGVALTAPHRALVSAWAERPPVLCADGDAAGRLATTRWVTEMTFEGRESYAVTLPDGRDPADWLAEHGTQGLLAFTRGYCHDGSHEIAPAHAGRYLAKVLAEDDVDIVSLKRAFTRMGARLPEPGARRRFASEAGRGLAEAGLAPDGWLERQVASALATGLYPAGDEGIQLGRHGVGV